MNIIRNALFVIVTLILVNEIRVNLWPPDNTPRVGQRSPAQQAEYDAAQAEKMLAAEVGAFHADVQKMNDLALRGYRIFKTRHGRFPTEKENLAEVTDIPLFVSVSKHIDSYTVYYDHTVRVHLNEAVGRKRFIDLKPLWRTPGSTDQLQFDCKSNLESKWVTLNNEAWCQPTP